MVIHGTSLSHHTYLSNRSFNPWSKRDQEGKKIEAVLEINLYVVMTSLASYD
jgi:hypothetical protein